MNIMMWAFNIAQQSTMLLDSFYELILKLIQNKSRNSSIIILFLPVLGKNKIIIKDRQPIVLLNSRLFYFSFRHELRPIKINQLCNLQKTSKFVDK